MRGAQNGSHSGAGGRGGLHREPHLHPRGHDLVDAQAGQNLSLISHARLHVDEWTGDHQRRIERADRQAPVLPRVVHGGARVARQQLTLEDASVDAHVGDELEGGHGGDHGGHERDAPARFPEPRVDEGVAHRRGGGVRGRIPCYNGRPRPINTPASGRSLEVTHEEIKGIEPVMGAIVVEVGESQPRTNEHGEEGIVEALAVLRKEVRRVGRARVQLADQPRLQRHVALVCPTVGLHGNPLVAPTGTPPSYAAITARGSPGLVRVTDKAGAKVSAQPLSEWRAAPPRPPWSTGRRRRASRRPSAASRRARTRGSGPGRASSGRP